MFLLLIDFHYIKWYIHTTLLVGQKHPREQWMLWWSSGAHLISQQLSHLMLSGMEMGDRSRQGGWHVHQLALPMHMHGSDFHTKPSPLPPREHLTRHLMKGCSMPSPCSTGKMTVWCPSYKFKICLQNLGKCRVGRLSLICLQATFMCAHL